MRAFVLLVVASLLPLVGCAPKAGKSAAVPAVPVTTGETPAGSALAPTPSFVAEDESAAVPVYPEDAAWGSPAAKVTLVAVLDLQCPFCGRLEGTLASLREHYGPEQLRIVVKHEPLPFHPFAAPAALAAIDVQRAAGNEAFFRFIRTVLSHQDELSGERLVAWAAAEKGSKAPAALALSPQEQLVRDLTFAQGAGALGTPTAFVNGAKVVGAQPYEVFVAKIDAELAAVDEAAHTGASPTYSSRVARNFVAPAAPEGDSAEEDDHVWKIPVDRSPTRGPDDALVTIVEFSDFQCPFCKRVQPTLDALAKRYGNDVRVVWKHAPLPFHDDARPAARLAVEALHEKGVPGFWALADALFARQADGFETEGLLAVARTQGLDPDRARRAILTTLHDPELAVDEDLAADFDVRGTPNFFINGRKLSGAQPLEAFVAAVDDALAVARAMVQKGVPRNRVYRTILDVADGPPAPPRVDIGPPPKDRPSRGPANAPVVIQEFSDFQCPFCARVQPTLDALLKEFPRDVRLVFRNLPLPFHPHAREAANAALEVRRLRGEAGFWKFHDSVFAHQQTIAPADLGALAHTLGLDAATIENAARTGRNDSVIAEDGAVAEKADIHGTPGFVVNGYVVSGAQPLSVFERAVRRALREATGPKAATAKAPLAAPAR